MWDAIWEAGERARADAARARGARHPPHRVGADLRRLRVRRPGRPVRGRIGFAVDLRTDDDFVGRDGAGGAPCAPAAHARRARARGQRDRRPRRRALRRPAARRRRHERDAEPDPEEEHRARAGRRSVRGARNDARGRQARRAPEADPGDRRPLPVLRPRQDAPALVAEMTEARRIVLCLPAGARRSILAGGDREARGRAALRAGTVRRPESSAGRMAAGLRSSSLRRMRRPRRSARSRLDAGAGERGCARARRRAGEDASALRRARRGTRRGDVVAASASARRIEMVPDEGRDILGRIWPRVLSHLAPQTLRK